MQRSLHELPRLLPRGLACACEFFVTLVVGIARLLRLWSISEDFAVCCPKKPEFVQLPKAAIIAQGFGQRWQASEQALQS